MDRFNYVGAIFSAVYSMFTGSEVIGVITFGFIGGFVGLIGKRLGEYSLRKIREYIKNKSNGNKPI